MYISESLKGCRNEKYDTMNKDINTFKTQLKTN